MKIIQKISNFLECQHSKEFCEEVVKLVSLENMRFVEQQKTKFAKEYWKDGRSGFVRTGMYSYAILMQNITLEERVQSFKIDSILHIVTGLVLEIMFMDIYSNFVVL